MPVKVDTRKASKRSKATPTETVPCKTNESEVSTDEGDSSDAETEPRTPPKTPETTPRPPPGLDLPEPPQLQLERPRLVLMDLRTGQVFEPEPLEKNAKARPVPPWKTRARASRTPAA